MDSRGARDDRRGGARGAVSTAAEMVLVKVGANARLQCCVSNKDDECRSCGAMIWWVITPRGRAMPIDPPEEEGDSLVESHFTSCPQGKTWQGAHR